MGAIDGSLALCLVGTASGAEVARVVGTMVGLEEIMGVSRDGNGADSDQVEPSWIRTRNPNSKSETTPNTGSGDNPNPRPNPVDPRNPIG